SKRSFPLAGLLKHRANVFCGPLRAERIQHLTWAVWRRAGSHQSSVAQLTGDDHGGRSTEPHVLRNIVGAALRVAAQVFDDLFVVLHAGLQPAPSPNVIQSSSTGWHSETTRPSVQ